MCGKNANLALQSEAGPKCFFRKDSVLLLLQECGPSKKSAILPKIPYMEELEVIVEAPGF